jgi:hypothetical protein
MGNYSKDRLRLVSQGIAGGRVWHYQDTGSTATVVDVAGFFTNAYDMGVRNGDFVVVQATDGVKNYQVHGSAFALVEDTGSTQGQTGPSTLIGDTG